VDEPEVAQLGEQPLWPGDVRVRGVQRVDLAGREQPVLVDALEDLGGGLD